MERGIGGGGGGEGRGGRREEDEERGASCFPFLPERSTGPV